MNYLLKDRGLMVAVYLAAALFIAAIISGRMIYSQELALELLGNLESTLSPLKDVHPALLFLFIFVNNAGKAFFVILLGIIAGLPALLFIYINGLIIGLVLSFAVSAQGWQTALAATLPHGILEIPLIILAVALSMLVGWESIRRLFRRTSRVKDRLLFGIRAYAIIILPGLFLAALIETFITPLIVGII
jgi:stage II sporulation protein M